METLHPAGNNTPSAAKNSVPAKPLLPAPANHNGALYPAEAAIVPQHERTVVMQAHLQLMEQFLRTQETVMCLFLEGEVPNGKEPLQIQAPTLVPRRVKTVEAVAHANGNVQAPPPPASTSPSATMPDALAMAPIQPAQVTPAQVTSEQITIEQITTVLLHLVGERTGYPKEMLDLTANLEADLGIDSIKRVEILGAFNRETGLLNPNDMDHVSSLKTLGAMLDFFHNGSLTK